MAVTEERQPMRCRSCGVFLGYRRRIGKFIFWCSQECADTPTAKYPDTQLRDDVIVEWFLGGVRIADISKLLDSWPYQYVQQTLARRGLAERHALSMRENPDYIVPLSEPTRQAS